MVGGFTRGNPPAHWHSIDNVYYGAWSPSLSNVAAAWPSADQALYTPILVLSRCIVKALWFKNGNTSAGNYDIGLYDWAGVKLVSSGSTAGTNSDATEIVWDCADTLIQPGQYYIGLSMSSTSMTMYRQTPSAPLATARGMLTEASALPLPSDATFAITQTLTYIPMVGMMLGTIVT